MAAEQDATWHGTNDEEAVFRKIVKHNCECQELDGVQLYDCGHQDLLSRQRVMDGMVFGRRIADQLKQQEFSIDSIENTYLTNFLVKSAPLLALVASKAVWHGNFSESYHWIQILGRNCECKYTGPGIRITTCTPHQMMEEDQRALNGLIWFRRIAPRLVDEEFSNGNFGSLSDEETDGEFQRYQDVKQQVAEFISPIKI